MQTKNPASSRTMFEIYRADAPEGGYRVVYFTELDAHERDDEIERVMSGEHVFDGFIAAGDASAKAGIAGVLARLNAGERLDAAAIGQALGPALR